MSTDQVRWKMNSLHKKYKECCDNNNKSGRGVINFKWYNQMDEIFGKDKDAIAAHTVSSNIILPEVNRTRHKENIHVPTSPVAGTSQVLQINKNKECTSQTQRHGTGTNLAKKKLNIEKQWLQFLENKEVRDAARDKRHEQSQERATEDFNKKKEIALKKLKDKENRHSEIMEIEKTKCNLLKKLLQQSNVKNNSEFDE
ncbi:hypothetical protein PUN28_019416 [Cardiocondyla obscurior]|uniref:No apical meristem-associated C-terminal domain-containing protein n=1 Tax=Cardiocondyla obscurior TaxID=286306 RepID=A0AAW2EFN6_9HYME